MRAALVLALITLSPPAAAGTADSFPEIVLAPAQARDAALTVYGSDLALVRQRFSVDLPRGPSFIRLEPVPEGLDPRSLQLSFETPGIRILEQDHLVDLLAPDRILELSVGQQVTLIQDDGQGQERRSTVELLSTRGGLILKAGDEILLQPGGRLAVPTLPPGLRRDPALRWLLESPHAVKTTLDILYLTSGLSWSADYVALLQEDSTRLDLSAWVSVANQTGSGFPAARLEVVAGDLNRTPRRGPMPTLARSMGSMEAMAAGDGFQEAALLDYHVYGLTRTVSLPGRSEKQIALHQARGIPAVRRYVVASNPTPGRRPPDSPEQRPVEVLVEFANTAAAGLGLPLPAGIVRLYQEDGEGRTRFVGEDRIGHAADGETLSVVSGRAFDLIAERLQTDYQDMPGRGGRRSYESAFQITLRNRKKEGVTIEIRESLGGDWTLMESSHPGRRRDAFTLQFDITVPAGGEAVLTYRIKVA